MVTSIEPNGSISFTRGSSSSNSSDSSSSCSASPLTARTRQIATSIGCDSGCSIRNNELWQKLTAELEQLNVLHNYRLPKTLYIQLDNCAKDNKNKNLFVFLAQLVLRGLFDKIKVGFEIVGHTHDRVDQLFSRLSVWLDHHDAMTLDELMMGFRHAFTAKTHQTRDTRFVQPEVFVLPHVMQTDLWLRGHFYDFKKFQHFHHFRFELDDSKKKVLMWTRRIAKPNEYEVYESGWNQPIEIANWASHGSLLKNSNPTPSPAYGLPRASLRDSFDSMLAAGAMNQQQRQWWETYVLQPDEQREAGACPQCSAFRDMERSPEYKRIRKESDETAETAAKRKAIDRKHNALQKEVTKHLQENKDTPSHTNIDHWFGQW